METVSTNNAEVDETGRRSSQYYLGQPEILRRILEQFPTFDLLELSLVNKLWNYEARNAMRERGNVRANLSRGVGAGNYEDDPCQKLVAFASDLERMRVVPFTGLHIPIYHDGAWCQSLSKEAADPFYKIILDRLPWKHFSVKFFRGWEDYNECPVLELVKLILKQHCGVLEELHLGYASEKFLGPIFKDRSMPNLKLLTIESSKDDVLPSSYLNVLVSCSPNLQQLHAHVRGVDLTVDLLEGSSLVFVPFRFRRCPLLKRICEGLISPLRAKTMEILIGGEGTDPEVFHRYIPLSLEASRATVTNLRMDLLFAVPLMCYGICLENVTNLQIHLNNYWLQKLEPSILELPKNLDFTRVFPKLTKVTICDNYSVNFPSDVVSAFIEQGKAVLSRALSDRAINIKTLKIDRMCSVERFTLRLLSQIFPDVKTVHTKASHRLPFALLREYFLCLEEVDERSFDRAF